MKRYVYIGIAILVILFGVFVYNEFRSLDDPSNTGSSSESSPAEERFRRILNAYVYRNMNNFEYESSDSAEGFTDKYHFTYNVGNDFPEFLTNYNNFPQVSDINAKFVEKSCSEIFANFAVWPLDGISLDNKKCYSGTVFPFHNYIIYDPSSGKVHHFLLKVG
jgi:hypothetical protein